MKLFVFLLLAVQAGQLAYSATQHSPTHLEPAFLASGLSHWVHGRFELYRVNPPLIRMVAALPVLIAERRTDWTHFYDHPGSRAEFEVGKDFFAANGPRIVSLVVYARWACIPFSLLGAYVAYLWAKDLYGSPAGLTALLLYAFSPNLLAHGELITPDSGCAAMGLLAGYTFWRWLKRRTWGGSVQAGAALGLALLSKLSWLFLLALWPLLCGIWLVLDRQRHKKNGGAREVEPTTPSLSVSFAQLAALLLVAVELLNFGYAFDGTGTPLKDYEFVSTSLTGRRRPGERGNRFQGTLLGQIPIPFPRQYVLGIDSQKRDFEDFGEQSYLLGTWRDGGWWYYYLYGFLVKVPCGTLLLLTLVVASRAIGPSPRIGRDEIVLLAPALVLIVLAGWQTEFNIHWRYVLPSLPFFLVFAGQVGRDVVGPFVLRKVLTLSLLVYTTLSSALTFPHHLAYFNDFAGGSANGYKHLLGSNLEWGQDWLALSQRAAQDGQEAYIVTSAVLEYQRAMPWLIRTTFEELHQSHRPWIAYCSWDSALFQAIKDGDVVLLGTFRSLAIVSSSRPAEASLPRSHVP